ncbi:class I SAM-dependent methyltransferase [Candidatus Pacearchaeota archaeon]|nr:class I SAM-dependent methyltransferase [Candidatus Pacearchaeota archaeon]
MSDKLYFGRERICAEFIDKNPKLKTLNIGAGEILWIENSLLRGYNGLVSSDIDKKNIGYKNTAKNKVIFDARNIPFKNNEFDQVIILDVLEHIKDHKGVLNEIYRILKKNGRLVISVPNDTWLSFLNPIRYAQHERHYSISMISNILKSNEFKIEKLFSGGKLWELMDLYTHLLIKYLTGRIINLKVFNNLRDKEYSKHHQNGNEIIILARKSELPY